MKISKSLLPAAALVALFAGCQDEDFGFTTKDVKSSKYADEFVKAFGEVDPNQDWSMAAETRALVNLPNIKGTAKMNIMTGEPKNPSTRLLGQIWLQDGQADFAFDAIEGKNSVFVTVEQDKEYVLYGSYNIVNGMLCVGDVEMPVVAAPMTRAFSDVCPATLDGEAAPSKQNTTYNASYEGTEGVKVITYINGNATLNDAVTYTFDKWKEIVEAQGGDYYNTPNGPFKSDAEGFMVFDESNNFVEFDWDNYVCKDDIVNGVARARESYAKGAQWHDGEVMFQYINDVEKQPTDPWTRGEMLSLFGSYGFFCEQNYYWGPKETTFDKTDLYGSTEAEKTATMQKLESGFVITSKGTPIDIPMVYAATGNNDQFGYILYQEGEDPLTKPHYVLMDNARPENIHIGSWESTNTFSGTNAYYQFMKETERLAEWMYQSDNDMTSYVNSYNTKVYGTKYRLMSFDENGNGSYTIEAGTKIVFFLIKSDSDPGAHEASINANALYYSLPELNARVRNLYITNSVDQKNSLTYKAGLAPEGAPKATAWKVGNQVYMGFEDGGADEDLNDVVFWAEGDFDINVVPELAPIKWHINKNKRHEDDDIFYIETLLVGASYTNPEDNPINGGKEFLGWSTSPTAKTGLLSIEDIVPAGGKEYYAIWKNNEEPDDDPEWASWIYACEDLGGSFDYDFNDLVFAVKKVSIPGSTNVDLQLIPLAAGGTLKAEIYYGDATDPIGEIHELLTGTKDFTTSILSGTGDAVTLATAVPATTRVDDISSQIKIKVTQKENSEIVGSYEISMKDHEKGYNTPEILVLPEGWDWPNEGVIITDVYPEFKNWSKDRTDTYWIDMKKEDSDFITNPIKPAGPITLTSGSEIPLIVTSPVDTNLGSFTAFAYNINISGYICPDEITGKVVITMSECVNNQVELVSNDKSTWCGRIGFYNGNTQAEGALSNDQLKKLVSGGSFYIADYSGQGKITSIKIVID